MSTQARQDFRLFLPRQLFGDFFSVSACECVCVRLEDRVTVCDAGKAVTSVCFSVMVP